MPATGCEDHCHDLRSGNLDVQRPVGPDPELIDPLRSFVSFPFHHVLFPYGFPVQIKANNPGVIRAAELSWAGFRQRFRETPIEVRFLVSEFPSRRKPASPIFRAQANLLTIVADQHNFGCCDLAAGFGFACITKAAVFNADYLRYNYLEAMVYTLLDTRHLVAMHAACVSLHGCGFLLIGDSGAGKSSFAYACARRGWTYVSDDASCIVRRRSGRSVLGNPQTFRFRPAASNLFPELQGQIKLRNNKPTLEVRTERLENIHTANEAAVNYLVFLNRSEAAAEAPHLAAVSREAALKRLLQQTWPTELAIHEERLQAIERLLEAEMYELNYGRFDPAIDLLEDLVRRSNPSSGQ
jgi:predicted ATPase